MTSGPTSTLLRELRARAGLRVAQPRVGDDGRRFVRVDELRVVVVERRDEFVVRVGRAVEDARALAALEVELVDPRTRRLRVPVRARRARAREEHGLVVAADDHDRLAVRARASWRARRRSPSCRRAAAAATTAAATSAETAATAGKRDAAAEVELLRRIRRAHGEHDAAVGDEHRLAVGTVRDARQAAAAFVHDLRVGRAERRQPVHVAHARRLRTLRAAAAATGAPRRRDRRAAARRPAANTDCRYTSPGPTGFHWMLRLPVSDAVGCAAATTPPRRVTVAAASAFAQRRLAERRDDLAGRVPQLLHRAEARDRHEVRERLDHARDAEVLRRRATHRPRGSSPARRSSAPPSTSRRSCASWPVV